jgi:hypothetical protein
MSIQYAGGTNVNATFTGSTKALLQSNVVSNLLTAGWSQATGPGGGGAQTVTITIASPGVITLAAHGLLANDSVVFATTGALPTGITAGTRYFVKTVLSSGTFTISGTAGGSVINTSGSQSGTQTMVGNVRMATAATAWSVTTRVNIQASYAPAKYSPVAGAVNGAIEPCELGAYRRGLIGRLMEGIQTAQVGPFILIVSTA